MTQKDYKLYNGNIITYPCLGTWQIDNEAVVDAVKTALELGYRHIDSARAYQNEEGVGRAIKESNVKREELYITTKVPAEVKSYEEAKFCISESLKKLGTYIDLILIHAPRPWKEMWDPNASRYFKENLEVWKALVEAYQEGSVKAIGVSNFQIDDIENIINNSDILPMVNQICIHIGNYPKELIEYCQKKNILVEAYSPNATGRLQNNEKVREMAEKYQVSVAQLGIRFDFQLDTLPLPKSTHREYMIQNVNIDFEISDEDMEYLKSL